MKVIYKKSVLDSILDEKVKAVAIGREIDVIELTVDEAREFGKLTGASYWRASGMKYNGIHLVLSK